MLQIEYYVNANCSQQELQEDDIDAAFGEDGEEDAELDDDDNTNNNNDPQDDGDDGDGGEEGDVENDPDEAAEGILCLSLLLSTQICGALVSFCVHLFESNSIVFLLFL